MPLFIRHLALVMIMTTKAQKVWILYKRGKIKKNFPICQRIYLNRFNDNSEGYKISRFQNANFIIFSNEHCWGDAWQLLLNISQSIGNWTTLQYTSGFCISCDILIVSIFNKKSSVLNWNWVMYESSFNDSHLVINVKDGRARPKSLENIFYTFALYCL